MEAVVFAAFALAVMLAVLGRLFWLAGRGLDFSDEGFYLNWIKAPYLYDISVSQFGFFYHPLFVAVGEDVVLLRQVNLAGTMLLAGLLCAIVCRTICSARWSETIAVAALASVTSMLPLQMWLPTPNYNWLCLQALLIAALGMVLVRTSGRTVSLVGWLLIGAGGYLAAMAKPTSAVALGLVVLAYLVVERRLNARGVLTAGATATGLAVATAIAIDGSLGGFQARILGGMATSGLLQSGHSFADIIWPDRLPLNRQELLFLLLAFGIAFFCSAQRRTADSPPAGVVFSALLPVISLLMFVGIVPTGFSASTFMGLAVAAGAAGALAPSLAAGWRGRSAVVVTPAGLKIALLLLPLCYAIGTNNNIWATAAAAGVFWVVGGIALAGRIPRDRRTGSITALATTAAAVTLIVLTLSSDKPYRQAMRLADQSEAVQLGTSGAILLSPGFAAYLRDLDAMAKGAGFDDGAPMLDLTGHYPAALFSVGGSAIGQPWLIGGYTGSADLAASVLRRVECRDLVQAWVLAEPGGPRSLPPEVVDFVLNLEEVGRLASPTGTYPDSYQQVLLRPAGDLNAAEARCAEAREMRP